MAAEDNSNSLVNFWPDFLAGSLAGSSGVAIGHPLDTIKVRKQSSYQFPQQSVLFTKAETSSYLTQLKVLYRGMLFPLVSEGARQSIFFGCYGFCLKHLEGLREEGHWYGSSSFNDRLTDKHKKYLDVSIASFLGGTVQAVLATPVEQIKVIKQAQRSNSRQVISTSDFLRNAIKSRYFVKHSAHTLVITTIRESFSFSAYMFSYAFMLDKIAEKMDEYRDEEKGRFTNKSLNDFGNSMFSGGMAGVVSWVVSIPADNIKTRLQVEFCSASPRYSGIMDCMVKMCQQEGTKSLFNGMGLVCLRAFPVNAVILTVYTYSLDWFSYML